MPDNVKEVLSSLTGQQQVTLRAYIASLREEIKDLEAKVMVATSSDDPDPHAHYHGHEKCTSDHGHGHDHKEETLLVQKIMTILPNIVTKAIRTNTVMRRPRKRRTIIPTVTRNQNILTTTDMMTMICLLGKRRPWLLIQWRRRLEATGIPRHRSVQLMILK